MGSGEFYKTNIFTTEQIFKFSECLTKLGPSFSGMALSEVVCDERTEGDAERALGLVSRQQPVQEVETWGGLGLKGSFRVRLAASFGPDRFPETQDLLN